MAFSQITGFNTSDTGAIGNTGRAPETGHRVPAHRASSVSPATTTIRTAATRSSSQPPPSEPRPSPDARNPGHREVRRTPGNPPRNT